MDRAKQRAVARPGEGRRLISPRLLDSRPMEVGKIKIGGKGEERQKRNGEGTYQLPTQYDHFVVTGRQRGEDGNFRKDEAVHQAVGEEPQELNIRLVWPDVESNFQSEMLVYKGTEKIWTCDGEEATNLRSGESGPCAQARGKDCKCKPYGRLAVILEDAPQYGGFYLFRSTSWETVRNLQSTLLLFESQFGSLRGLPLKLIMYQATDRDAQGNVYTNWKVGVVLRYSFEQARTAALEFHRADQMLRRELQEVQDPKMIEAGEPEEEEDVGPEFFPPDPSVSRETPPPIEAEAREAENRYLELAQVVGLTGEDRERWEEAVMGAVREAWGKAHYLQAINNLEDGVGLRGILEEEEPVYRNQAGEEIEGDEEVPGPAPEPEEEEEELSDYEKAKRRYGELCAEIRLTDARRLDWQENVIGKRNANTWSTDDYERAVAHLEEHGVREEDVDPGAAEPEDAGYEIPDDMPF